MNVIRFSLKISIYLIILLVLNNCSVNNNKTDNTYQVISLLVNETYRSYSKIPSTLNKRENNFQNDSINKKEFIFILDNKLRLISKTFGLSKHKEEYQKMFEELSSFSKEKDINLKYITVSKNIKMVELTNEHIQKMKNNNYYSDFDLYISFSRIAFNKSNDKALVAISTGDSSLSSSYDLFYLKMQNGKWKIIDFQNISIS